MANFEEDLDAPLDAPRDNETRTNLIINYLPQSMSDDEFFSLFVSCGPIATARIARDNVTGYSFGYGFVNYEAPDDAIKAIDTYNGYQVQNKRLKVSYSRPKGDSIKDTNLFIQNLGRDVGEDMLTNLFSQYGSIITKKILMDHKTGVSKGTAFVRFSKKEEAQEAIKGLDGTTPFPDSSSTPISVRIAEEHGKQKAEQIKMAFTNEFAAQAYSYPSRGQGFRGNMRKPSNFHRQDQQFTQQQYHHGYNSQGYEPSETSYDEFYQSDNFGNRGGGGNARGHRFNPMSRGDGGWGRGRGGFQRRGGGYSSPSFGSY